MGNVEDKPSCVHGCVDPFAASYYKNANLRAKEENAVLCYYDSLFVRNPPQLLNENVFALLLGAFQKSPDNHLHLLPEEIFREVLYFAGAGDDYVLIQLFDCRAACKMTKISIDFEVEKTSVPRPRRFFLSKWKKEESLVEILRKKVFKDTDGHSFNCYIQTNDRDKSLYDMSKLDEVDHGSKLYITNVHHKLKGSVYITKKDRLHFLTANKINEL